MWIRQWPDWPTFSFDAGRLAAAVADYRHRAAQLAGGVARLAVADRQEALVDLLVSEAIKTSARDPRPGGPAPDGRLDQPARGRSQHPVCARAPRALMLGDHPKRGQTDQPRAATWVGLWVGLQADRLGAPHPSAARPIDNR